MLAGMLIIMLRRVLAGQLVPVKAKALPGAPSVTLLPKTGSGVTVAVGVAPVAAVGCYRARASHTRARHEHSKNWTGQGVGLVHAHDSQLHDPIGGLDGDFLARLFAEQS